jgi:uncharacterized membrane protein
MEHLKKENALDTNINIGQNERWLHLAGGAALLALGAVRGGFMRWVLTAIGGTLLYQGVTGHSPMYQMMGMNTALKTGTRNAAVPQQQGIHVTRVITINRPIEELYAYWRNFENLPRIMHHVESVRVLDDKRSHWKVKAPAGMSVEWDAEIVNEERNKVIGWRSLPDAQIPNAGSVRFNEAYGGRGTELTVQLEYVPPAGEIGAAIAKLFGKEPSVQIDEDLRRFKQMMEAGEMASTAGQSMSASNGNWSAPSMGQ